MPPKSRWKSTLVWTTVSPTSDNFSRDVSPFKSTVTALISVTANHNLS